MRLQSTLSMNIYISKNDTSHRFTISLVGNKFHVTKPSGSVYVYDNPKNFEELDKFVTNNEIINSITQGEKKEKDNDFLTSTLNSSILNGEGYSLFNFLLDNITELTGFNYLFYNQLDNSNDTEEYILMFKNIDSGDEMEAIDFDNFSSQEISNILGAAVDLN